MKILIAPDKFKGALSARDVAKNVAKGLLDVLPDADIKIVPMADGGEGTAEAICEARGCFWVECKARDPLGRKIDARYGWIDQEKLAVMEMSEAAGMRRLSETERDPVRAGPGDSGGGFGIGGVRGGGAVDAERWIHLWGAVRQGSGQLPDAKRLECAIVFRYQGWQLWVANRRTGS